VKKYMGTYNLAVGVKRAVAEHPSYQREGADPLYMSHMVDTHVATNNVEHESPDERIRLWRASNTAHRAAEDGKDLWIIGPRKIASLARKYMYVHTHAPVPDRIEKELPHEDDPLENHWIVDKGPHDTSHTQAELKITCVLPDQGKRFSCCCVSCMILRANRLFRKP
jgi:hypothetical protein